MNIFKTFILILICSFFVSSVSFAQSKDEKAIVAVMRLEEKYWNDHDIDGYVSLYAPEDSTRMILTKGEAFGRPGILAFYKKYWPKDKMGHLTLDGEKMERLSRKYYYVTGYFHVKTAEGKMIHGRYSSLMKKINGKWYLYTDHSA